MPVLGPLPPNSRSRSPTSVPLAVSGASSESNLDSPTAVPSPASDASLSALTPVVRSPSRAQSPGHPMSSRTLVFPTLSEPLTADAIETWVTKCDDGIEVYVTFNPSVTVADRTKILCASTAFDSASAKLNSFWRSERDSLLSGSWLDFKSRLRSQFLGTDSKVDALQAFFLARPGST